MKVGIIGAGAVGSACAEQQGLQRSAEAIKAALSRLSFKGSSHRTA
jgi:homoserine dehydrogenase